MWGLLAKTIINWAMKNPDKVQGIVEALLDLAHDDLAKAAAKKAAA